MSHLALSVAFFARILPSSFAAGALFHACCCCYLCDCRSDDKGSCSCSSDNENTTDATSVVSGSDNVLCSNLRTLGFLGPSPIQHNIIRVEYNIR